MSRQSFVDMAYTRSEARYAGWQVESPVRLLDASVPALCIPLSIRIR